MESYKFKAQRKVGSRNYVTGDYYKKWIYDRGKENLRHYIGWQSTDENGKIWNEYCEVIPETVELLEK